MSHPLLLVPTPRQITADGGSFSLPITGQIVAPADALARPAAALHRHLPTWDIITTESDNGKIQLDLTDDAPDQSYTLQITPQGITLQGDERGIFYGVMTLAQIIRQNKDTLPCLTIDDWPDYPARGVMLDISRDKVPSQATLIQLIEDLAALKINQIQLYTEHTFAYQAHEVVWRDASPLTAEEIRELNALCQQYYIDLVPNQNSLGHMERWLKHEPYHALSETPDGFLRTWDNRWSAPTTLNPLDPASLQLIAGLYEELLPNFTSGLFNVGCDEPWELGQGKSREEVEKRGGNVYLDWLKSLRELVNGHGRQMMFWADIIHHHPDLIPELPRDIIAMEWGYEANHPFDVHCARFADVGVPFYVCPGTSAWNSLVGRWDNACENLRLAALHGRKNGAIGYLITEWGDNGHWQPLTTCYPAFAYGAGISWAYDANRSLDLVSVLDTHIFKDTNQVMGALMYDIGEVYRMVKPEHINGQVLAYALQWSRDDIDAKRALYEKWGADSADITPQNLRAVLARLKAARARLKDHAMQTETAPIVEREVAQAIDLLAHGAKWLLFAQGEGDHDAQALQVELTSLIANQREVWLLRNRAGGLEDSIARFDTLLGMYQ